MPHVSGPGTECLKTPRLDACSSRKAELIEWNRNLHNIPPLIDFSCAVPNNVPGPVFDSVLIAEDRIGLNSQRIHAHLNSAPLIVERIDHHSDVIILDESIDGIAVHDVGSNLRRLRIKGAKCDVKIVLIKRHETVRLYWWRDVITRGPLVSKRNNGSIFPCLLLQYSIYSDFRRRLSHG